jgi:hypothetical protein
MKGLHSIARITFAAAMYQKKPPEAGLFQFQ